MDVLFGSSRSVRNLIVDDINDSFDNTDVSVVIGANDVINPAARDTCLLYTSPSPRD